MASGLADGGRVVATTGAMAGTLPPGTLPSGIRATVPGREFNTEAYDRIDDNAFRAVTQDPLSTFSIDVDTASYANVRRFLNGGSLPPRRRGADRRADQLLPFRLSTRPARADAAVLGHDRAGGLPMEPAASPGARRPAGARTRHRTPCRARNLVFLLDVSGSMAPPDKLPLVRTAMRMLVDTLTAAGPHRDRRLCRRERHRPAVDERRAQGRDSPGDRAARGGRLDQRRAPGSRSRTRSRRSTSSRAGINRVILATDGDFNVGVTSQGELTRLIEEKRASGVFLSVLGVGTGNIKDSTMEKLADKGNGNYAYLDSLHEARKVLVARSGRDAGDGREGRQDPGRVQPDERRRLPADRLREPDAAASRTSTTTGRTRAKSAPGTR